MLRNGVGAMLSGVCGSNGAGLLSFSISAWVVPRSISMPPLEECTGDTNHTQSRWISYLKSDLLCMNTSFGRSLCLYVILRAFMMDTPSALLIILNCFWFGAMIYGDYYRRSSAAYLYYGYRWHPATPCHRCHPATPGRYNRF